MGFEAVVEAHRMGEGLPYPDPLEKLQSLVSGAIAEVAHVPRLIPSGVLPRLVAESTVVRVGVDHPGRVVAADVSGKKVIRQARPLQGLPDEQKAGAAEVQVVRDDVLALAEFVGALAITESVAFKSGLLGALLRLAAVFLLSLFVITSMVRELNDKQLELVLALPIARVSYFLG